MSPRTASPTASPQARLDEHVSVLATELLNDAVTLTPAKLAERVRATQPRLVDAAAKDVADKLLLRAARSCLKTRADQPLQTELDLGLPEHWTLRCRHGDDGSLYYVLAAEANEDDLLAAEEERRHKLRQAETKATTAGDRAQAAVDAARTNLERLQELLGRLAKAEAGVG